MGIRKKSLLQYTSRVSEPVCLFLVLDTLGDQIDLHTGRQRDVAAHQILHALIVVNFGDERAVDLQPVDGGDVQQIRQAGMVDPPEIIDGQVESDATGMAQRHARRGRISVERAFGELQADVLRGDPPTVALRADQVVEEAAFQHVVRRQVHVQLQIISAQRCEVLKTARQNPPAQLADLPGTFGQGDDVGRGGDLFVADPPTNQCFETEERTGG